MASLLNTEVVLEGWQALGRVFIRVDSLKHGDESGAEATGLGVEREAFADLEKNWTMVFWVPADEDGWRLSVEGVLAGVRAAGEDLSPIMAFGRNDCCDIQRGRLKDEGEEKVEEESGGGDCRALSTVCDRFADEEEGRGVYGAERAPTVVLLYGFGLSRRLCFTFTQSESTAAVTRRSR